jgi:hypothetical protein
MARLRTATTLDEVLLQCCTALSIVVSKDAAEEVSAAWSTLDVSITALARIVTVCTMRAQHRKSMNSMLCGQD